MTPAYTLIQLLKLEALSFDDIVKYTGWTHEKTTEIIEGCKASGEIEWKHKPSRYAVPAVPEPQRSPITQCLQPTMPNVWGRWRDGNTAIRSTKRRREKTFARVARELCEIRPQRSGIATAGEGVASE